MSNVLLNEQAAPTALASATDLKGLVKMYRLSNQVEGKSPKTTVWYDEMLLAFVSYMERQQMKASLSAYNIDIVRGYILYLQHKPRFQGHPRTPAQAALLSPKTVQCHVRALKAFASWLHAEGHTNENRLKNLKLPKAPLKMIEPLTPAEIEKITITDKTSPLSSRNRAIVLLALDTGLRASEIAGVTLGQLNLQNGLVKVMGKGARERIVPLGKFVQATLWHYIEKVRPKPANTSIDNLFLSHDGKPITVNSIKLMFARLAKHSGVKRLHAHLCRHTFATSYLINGGDIFSLRGILGHHLRNGKPLPAFHQRPDYRAASQVLLHGPASWREVIRRQCSLRDTLNLNHGVERCKGTKWHENKVTKCNFVISDYIFHCYSTRKATRLACLL